MTWPFVDALNPLPVSSLFVCASSPHILVLRRRPTCRRDVHHGQLVSALWVECLAGQGRRHAAGRSRAAAQPGWSRAVVGRMCLKLLLNACAFPTSPPARSCLDRCPNTPHAWQLGWISLQQLDVSNFLPGHTVTATLPSLASNRTSASAASPAGLRIELPRWAADGVEPLFVGYRTREGPDWGLLNDGGAGRVHVYRSAVAHATSIKVTTWLRALAMGERRGCGGRGAGTHKDRIGLALRARKQRGRCPHSVACLLPPWYRG